jgi:hypothetical protein
MFSGAKLFHMKTTHGVPLDVTLQVLKSKGITVTWASFIDEARINKWWDFQIIQYCTDSLGDAGYSTEDISEIIQRMKLYILQNEHPMMKK